MLFPKAWHLSSPPWSSHYRFVCQPYSLQLFILNSPITVSTNSLDGFMVKCLHPKLPRTHPHVLHSSPIINVSECACFLTHRMRWYSIWLVIYGFFRARAPNGERPYWNCKDYYFFPGKRRGFLRALTCSKSFETCQRVRKWWKFTYSGVFKKGRGEMAQQRHLERSP